MSEEMVLWIIRLGGLGLAAWLLVYARKFYLRREQQWQFICLQQSGDSAALAEAQAQAQKTSRLNPSFFGKNNLPLAADRLPDAPILDLPLCIMARPGFHFSGADVAELVRSFGLQRSPNGVYELINENGRDILFSMLNIHQPGVFAQDLTQMPPINGVMLVLQLPNCGDAVKDWENFLAIVKDMADICGGRLCNYERRQISAKDLLIYRQAAEKYQLTYEHWLAQNQR